MSVETDTYLAESSAIVLAYGAAAPSTNTCAYINLRDGGRLAVLIQQTNGTTGAAVTMGLQQATSTSGGSVKTLNFTQHYANTNAAGANPANLSLVTGDSNSFSTDSTASKSGIYVLEVKASDLDVTNNFNCVRLNPGTSGAGATFSATYIVRGQAYKGAPPLPSVT